MSLTVVSSDRSLILMQGAHLQDRKIRGGEGKTLAGRRTALTGGSTVSKTVSIGSLCRKVRCIQCGISYSPWGAFLALQRHIAVPASHRC